MGRVQMLSRVDSLPATDFAYVARSRRSSRDFREEPADEVLGHFLYLSCFAHATKQGPHGYALTQTCAPSAGAIHGINVLLSRPSWQGVWRYDPFTHSLVEMDASDALEKHVRSSASKALDLTQAALLMLVAEPGKYAAKYEACESLVWRDAGALLGTMALVAENLSMDFCPLGITGESTVRLLDQELQLAGVGLAALGSR
jgi:SagB-type dehydrogenase family enzyme